MPDSVAPPRRRAPLRSSDLTKARARARYYRISSAGRRAVGEELESWRRFAGGLEAVLRTARATRITLVLSAVALLLSLAGAYAVLAYTVARRTREIGVCMSLGASRRRIVAAIFRRPLAQVGLGVVAGSFLIAAGAFALSGPKGDGSVSQIGDDRDVTTSPTVARPASRCR